MYELMNRFSQWIYNTLNAEITVWDAIEKGLLLVLLGILVYWLVTDYCLADWIGKDGKAYELRARSGKVVVEE